MKFAVAKSGHCLYRPFVVQEFIIGISVTIHQYRAVQAMQRELRPGGHLGKPSQWWSTRGREIAQRIPLPTVDECAPLLNETVRFAQRDEIRVGDIDVTVHVHWQVRVWILERA